MIPPILQITPQEYLEQYKTDIINISNGRLFDFTSSSVLSILGEAQSLAIARLIESEVELIDLIAARVVENLGFIRDDGDFAIATARYQLTNTFDRDFIIYRGHRFLVNDITFETTSDLVIPAFIDTKNPLNYQYCRVSATAITKGTKGNSSPGQVGILQQMIELDSIWLDEASTGGREEEATDVFFSRVSALISKVLENQTSIVSTKDFENEIYNILGTEIIAIAIPDITRDGAALQLASMNVYLANKNGLFITLAQRNQISTEIEKRSPLVQGRLYFSDLVVPLVDINISIELPPGKDFNTVANVINTNIRDRFSISETAAMSALELYEVIYQVKRTSALFPIVTWGYFGGSLYARNLPLPKVAIASTKTSPIIINRINITLEPLGLTKTYDA